MCAAAVPVLVQPGEVLVGGLRTYQVAFTTRLSAFILRHRWDSVNYNLSWLDSQADAVCIEKPVY